MKMRIVIDVERVDGPLTDTDMSAALRSTKQNIDIPDVSERLVGPFSRDGLRWSYAVEEVKPC